MVSIVFLELVVVVEAKKDDRTLGARKADVGTKSAANKSTPGNTASSSLPILNCTNRPISMGNENKKR